MKISFNVDDVITQLQLANGVISPKNVIEALSNFVIRTYNSRSCAIVMASDGDMWVETKIPLCGEERDTDFSFAVNAKDFVSALKVLGGVRVDMSIPEGSSVADVTYDSGSFKIPVDNADEFPSHINDSDGGFERIVGSQSVLDAIGYTEIAVENDILRPIVNGIHFDFFSDRMVAVALNKVKFVKYTDKSVASDSEGVEGFTMPIKVARTVSQFLSKYDGDVKIVFNEKSVVVSRSEFRIIARLTEGTYPPYERVMTGGTPISVKICRVELIDILKRVMPMANASSNCVKILLENGNMYLSTEDLSMSKSANGVVGCDYEGEPFGISLKGIVLLSVLTNLSCNDINFGVSDKMKPVIITPADEDAADVMSLIMPML